MKYILKQPVPLTFLQWQASGTEHWQPSYAQLSNPLKRDVKQSLMEEQGFICCYCESRLNEDDSHIEHFKPQHLKGVDPLDYSNLMVAQAASSSLLAG